MRGLNTPIISQEQTEGDKGGSKAHMGLVGTSSANLASTLCPLGALRGVAGRLLFGASHCIAGGGGSCGRTDGRTDNHKRVGQQVKRGAGRECRRRRRRHHQTTPADSPSVQLGRVTKPTARQVLIRIVRDDTRTHLGLSRKWVVGDE